jgi:ABC-type Co2+ transport system permease subunit
MTYQNLDLKNYGMASISEKEQNQIYGGNPFIMGLAGAWLATVIYETVNDWNNNVAAFQNGYNSVRNK